MRVRIRGKSYFAFETLPPPLRGPPPSTEGGEGCAVSLNVGRLSCSRRLQESNFAFGKSQRLLRRSLHVVQVLSVPLCYTSKTSSRWRSLRMTYSRGVRGGRLLRKPFVSAGGDPLIHRERSPFPSGEGFLCVRATRRGALCAPAFPTKVSLVLERANAVRPYGFEHCPQFTIRLCF